MKHDQEKVKLIVQHLGWKWFVTGSFVVNPENANDIDIVIQWDIDTHEKLIAIGAENTNIRGYEGKARTLQSTWRLGVYNILVVKDEIAFALWKAFTNVIAHEEYAFVEKSDRIQLADFIMGAYRTPKANHTITMKKEINFDAQN